MPVTSPRRDVELAYAAALHAHLAEASESTLRAAYELGRDAVVGELSVLDLAAAHHEALLAALRRASGEGEVERATRAAGDFFLESLSAFEMVRRGVVEAREAALAERRQSTMLRQLSNLLADPSLALGESDSLAEALRLVAEEARELTTSRYCVATAALQGGRTLSEAAADPEADADPSAVAGADDLAGRHALVRAAGGPMRLGARELADEPAFRGLRETEGGDSPRAWMAAPLTFLDSRHFGCLEVFDKEEGDFTELDEAVLAHLARMASTALERAHLYRRRR